MKDIFKKFNLKPKDLHNIEIINQEEGQNIEENNVLRLFLEYNAGYFFLSKIINSIDNKDEFFENIYGERGEFVRIKKDITTIGVYDEEYLDVDSNGKYIGEGGEREKMKLATSDFRELLQEWSTFIYNNGKSIKIAIKFKKILEPMFNNYYEELILKESSILKKHNVISRYSSKSINIHLIFFSFSIVNIGDEFFHLLITKDFNIKDQINYKIKQYPINDAIIFVKNEFKKNLKKDRELLTLRINS